MKKFYFPVILLFFSCNTSTTSNVAPGNISNTAVEQMKKDSFFPVTSFIKGQLLTLDSLQVTPLHTTTVNGKTDSSWIKKNELACLLKDFISPEIKETNLTSYFKETSFQDQTINAITFTYDPSAVLPDSVSLRHWDVYIEPETGKVTKVYLVKQVKEKDRSITQQLTWKTDKWASINTLLDAPNGNSSLIKTEKFTWNFNE